MKRKSVIIIGIIIAIAVAFAISIAKAKALVRIFQQITIEPKGISGLKASLNRIEFGLDILLVNPSPEAFEVNGMGVAKLKEISVFYDGVFIAKTQINLTQISIPANNQLLIPKVPVTIDYPLQFLQANIALAYEMVSNFNENKLSTTGIIQVAGQEISI